MTENLLTTEMKEDGPIDITNEANFIWSIANKLRGSYMPDKYGDVIIPMTIIRRFECVLEKTKEKVVEQYEKNPNYPAKAMYRLSGKPFYNTSKYNLQLLGNDPDHIAANFKSYINGFSSNVKAILNELNMEGHINKMEKDGALYNVVKAFSELDLSEENFVPIKMGYIFENLIGRFYQNVEAGQFYTGRDIINMMVSVLTAEGCNDIFDEGKVITVLDQASGTGGMLSTAYRYIKNLNPTADIRLFGQELMGQSYAVGLAEMLIKGQNAENFLQVDTLKEDKFPGIEMRFLLENPPFGTSWKGRDAKNGQEAAVMAEYRRGEKGRFPAGLPGGGDSQLLFMQSAVTKMAEEIGRGAIITNGSPLFTGGVSSGESQIRRWLLENDLIEAIIAMPTDLFYNTGIATYVWVLSKNKRDERKGKIQLIDATDIYTPLRKSLGNKRREFTKKDQEKIVALYSNFEENELSQIHANEEFIYKEYTVMQPLQRSYGITEERIENMVTEGALRNLFDEAKYLELIEKEESAVTLSKKEEKELKKYNDNKPLYESIVQALNDNVAYTLYMSQESFEPVLEKALKGLSIPKREYNRILDGLSEMDKEAEIHRNAKGEIIYDTTTKDTEIVNIRESIDDYMEREVLPHVPDAKAFFEENLDMKNPRIKTGAEIPFTRYFYKYEKPESSETLKKRFLELEASVNKRVQRLFGEV